MMAKTDLTFFKDKKEKITCELQVEGASLNDTKVRLCLELPDGNNRYFNGIVENGNCIIDIPALKDITHDKGSAFIEIIADGNYFKVYEADAHIKNAVNVKINQDNFIKVTESSVPKVTIKLVPPVQTRDSVDEDVENDIDYTDYDNILETVNNIKQVTEETTASARRVLNFNDFKRRYGR